MADQVHYQTQYGQTHYEVLKVSPRATQSEIKQAYRRLVKLVHPDSNQVGASHEATTQINAAYEVISDPQRRHSYDRALQRGRAAVSSANDDMRQQRAASAQQRYRAEQPTSQEADEHLQRWLKQVYAPVDRCLGRVLRSLRPEINALAADPFDDELMADFQEYLEECRQTLRQAQGLFQSMPNPTNVAGIAAHVYYCLNQLHDAIEQLDRFTLSYDDSFLHTGQEMFRIAGGLRQEAQSLLGNL